MTLLLAVAAFVWPAHAAERLVAIGGDVTEIVFELGAGDRLVAVDSTSRHPEAADALPDVGYLRRLAAEPIVALQPDLVIASAASGPPIVLDQLRGAGLEVVMISDGPNVSGVVTKIGEVGRALGLEREAATLGAAVREDVERVQVALGAIAGRPRVLFMLDIGRGAPLAGGLETSAASIIELAGGRNAIEGFSGYKPLSQEAAIAAMPDVVLVPTRTLDAFGGAAGLFARPELRASPAAAERRVVAMDSLLLLGFGPRPGEAVTTLAGALHPELVVAAP